MKLLFIAFLAIACFTYAQQQQQQITRLPRFTRPILQVHDPFRPWQNDNAMQCFTEALAEYNIDLKSEFLQVSIDFQPLHYDSTPLSRSLRIEDHKRRDSGIENFAWTFGRFLPSKCTAFAVRDSMRRDVKQLITTLETGSVKPRDFTALARPVVAGDLRAFRQLLCAEQVAHVLDAIERADSVRQVLSDASKYGHWYLHAIAELTERCAQEEIEARANGVSMFFGSHPHLFGKRADMWKPFLISKVWDQYDKGCVVSRTAESFVF